MIDGNSALYVLILRKCISIYRNFTCNSQFIHEVTVFNMLTSWPIAIIWGPYCTCKYGEARSFKRSNARVN